MDELRRKWMRITLRCIAECSDAFDRAADSIIADAPDKTERTRECLIQFFKVHTAAMIAEVERCQDPDALQLLFHNTFGIVNETLLELEQQEDERDAVH